MCQSVNGKLPDHVPRVRLACQMDNQLMKIQWHATEDKPPNPDFPCYQDSKDTP